MWYCMWTVQRAIHTCIYVCVLHVHSTETYVCTVGVQKIPIYRPYNGMGNIVPFLFPFNYRAVAVFVRFQTIPFVLRAARPFK